MKITKVPAEQTSTVAPTTTAALAARLASLVWTALTPQAVIVAKQCLLDWIGVTLAGHGKPLVRILLDEFADSGECTLVGSHRRARLRDAVLINGAASHALDFDDVNPVMGHPTVPVAPVVFSLAEVMGASGRQALLAFIAGVEIECRVGCLLGPSHYAKGWHSTATTGTFGAMGAAAKLSGLHEDQMLHAFGLAGTQAAGLKSVFGTMSKPLHAGLAAQSGLLAASLAGRGFTSDTEILDSSQGFVGTQSTTVNRAEAIADLPRGFHVVDTLFKYHAACYLTHNAIEAAAALREAHRLTPEMIDTVSIQVNAAHMGVCNIQDPRTGLECKFSLCMTAAMALTGEDTFQDALYSNATANRPDLVALRRKVIVRPDAAGPGSTVTVRLNDGRELTQTVDVAVPVQDLAVQQNKLEQKFFHLATPKVGRERAEKIAVACRTLERAAGVDELLALCRSG